MILTLTFRSVTKFDKRNMAITKKVDKDVMPAYWDVFAFDLIFG